MTKNFKRHVAIMLSTLILLGRGNGRVLADDRGNNLDGNSSEITAENSVEEVISEEKILPWDGSLEESVFHGNGFKVEFNLKEHWDTGYNANVKITNTSDETIENWALGFNYNDRISNIWNAKIVEDENIAGENNNNSSDLKPFVIKNDVWNQDILPGSSVEFGFSGTGDFKGFPSKYHILGEKCLADPEDYYVEYTLSSDWGSGFNSSIMISNVSDKDIEDWSLEFDFGRDITNIWNGTIPSCEDGHYLIKNSDYNSIIYANHNIQFGFSGCNGSADIVPTDYKLYYYDLSREKADNKEEKNSESNAFHDENNSNPVENEKEETNTENTNSEENNQEEEKHTDDAHHEGNLNETQEEKHTDDAKPIDNGQTSDPDKEEQNNPVEEIDKTKDTDKDGLFDYIELQIGTDINKTDTDEDGLSDYFEIMSMSYDPTMLDTDNNGINDGEEDLDNDGLTNLKELEINTDPSYPDSDEDGLKDGEEINTYNTDPCKYDTDGDYVSDGKEIELGTDPLIYNEKFEVTVTADDVDTVKASVKISLNGKQVNTLSVNRFNNDFLFPEDMPGYIGGAYDFKVEGEFDQATLCFEFDEALLAEDNFDPVIYYFDEEEQWLYELNTTVEGNVAAAVTTHFSKYILLNRKEFNKTKFNWIDTWSENRNIHSEIVLCIDDSSSLGGYYEYNEETESFLGGTDPEHKRLSAARNFIDNTNQNIKIGIVKFDSEVNWISDGLVVCDERGKEALKKYLKFKYTGKKEETEKEQYKKIFNSVGTTDMFAGIMHSDKYFSEDSEISKNIIVFTDGEADEEDRQWSYVTRTYCREHGIKVFFIGLDNEEQTNKKYFDNDLTFYARYTGGKVFYAPSADALEDIYTEIAVGLDIKADTDNDGLPDCYEDGLILFNGKCIRLDKNNPDTDGDGIKDGEEIKLIYKYNEVNGIKKLCVIGKVVSNPLSLDTDGDLVEDSLDKEPFFFQLNPQLCYNIAELDELAIEYLNKHNNEGFWDGWDVYSTKDEILVFSFIRSFNPKYDSGLWDAIGGKIDYTFIDYVKNENYGVYLFFRTNPNYIADMGCKKGDLYHLAATMTGLLYTTDYRDAAPDARWTEAFKYQFMFELFLDELSGWAGDLQTAMMDCFNIYESNNFEHFYDYDYFYSTMRGLIGSEDGDSSFSLEDLYADIDAYNLYSQIIHDNRIKDVVVNYFHNGFNKRFTTFVEYSGGEQFKRRIYLYTINEYMGFQWPLLRKKIKVTKKDENADTVTHNEVFDIVFTDKQSIAAGTAFRDYINERLEDEK